MVLNVLIADLFNEICGKLPFRRSSYRLISYTLLPNPLNISLCF